MSTVADDRPDAPPTSSDPATPGDKKEGDAGRGWFGRHQQTAWIAAGATLVGALITALVPVLASSGDDKADSGPVAVPTPSASGSAPAPQSATPSTPPSSQTESSGPDHSTAPGGSELWRGSLLLDTEPKDLDATPPVPVGYADEGDVYMLPGNEFEGWNSTLIARWPGGTGALPGYQDCLNIIGPSGSREKQRLSKTTVLCVRTSDRNIARLKVTELGSDGIGSDSRATFDAVIWNAS